MLEGPYELGRYKFEEVQELLKVDLSDRFIVMLVVNSQSNRELRVYRKAIDFSNYLYFNWTDSAEKIKDFVFNEVDDSLLIILETKAVKLTLN